jgi:DNA-binding GntR family transcriptional regulator
MTTGLLLDEPADATAPPQPWRDVADRIAADVQAGLLPPGTWLKQIDLERRYACSRNDVRRALDELVTRRLVQHLVNRGHRVFELAPGQIADLMELRAVLEEAVAERIHDRADAAALERLEQLAQAFERAVQHDTPLAQHAANMAFHMAMLELCPNPELAQALRDVRSRLPSALVYQWPTRGWIDQSVRDHRDMVEALRDRDRGRLRALAVGHLRQGQRGAATADAGGSARHP